MDLVTGAIWAALRPCNGGVPAADSRTHSRIREPHLPHDLAEFRHGSNLRVFLHPRPVVVVDLGRVLLTDRRQGGASASHVCRDNTDGVVRCANQGCTLCLADADPVVTGWPLS